MLDAHVIPWDPVLWGLAGGIFGSNGWMLKGLRSKGHYQMDGNTCGIGQKWENPTAGPFSSKPATGNSHSHLPWKRWKT